MRLSKWILPYFMLTLTACEQQPQEPAVPPFEPAKTQLEKPTVAPTKPRENPFGETKVPAEVPLPVVANQKTDIQKMENVFSPVANAPLPVVENPAPQPTLPAVNPIKGKWEVRYAQLPDQKPEWTAAGYVPAYNIELSNNGEEVFIDSAENPDYRGVVMMGRRFTVPQTLENMPKALFIDIEYQTWNEPEARSCSIYFYLMTAERYEKFSADPAAAKLDNLPIFSQRKWTDKDWNVLAQETVYRENEDVETWQAWESPDLAPYLRNKKGQDLVAVFAFQAAHRGFLQWGRFRNFHMQKLDESAMWKKFISTKLDLERPDMQGVKAALAADDLDRACAAFVEHMKHREKPVLPESDLPMTADEKMIEKADELARRYFNFGHGSKPVQWGDTPQWNANPPNYEQWTIGNNRHGYWLTMGRAYVQTQDEKYPKEYAVQLKDFMQRYPYYIGDKELWAIDGPIVSFGRMNMTLNSGSRMSANWWPAYAYFRKSPSLTVMDHMWIWKGFYEHANHMADPRVFHPEGNWGSWEAAGLYKCGVMMPEFKDSAHWIKTAEKRLQLLLTTLVYPDGTPKEISVGYHLANAGFFRGAVVLANANGLSLNPQLKQTIEKMYEIVMFSSRPGFGSVGFGDANWSLGAVPNAANQVKDLFPEREDFEYFATKGASGTPPSFTSWMSPWVGWYCMRTGWTPEDNYLVLDAGPLGTSHYHTDKLGIVVHIGNQMVLHETGNYAYDNSPMQHYVRSTWAHNTVIVDEKIQKTAFRETQKPLDQRWITNEHFDFADGVYNLGFVKAGKPESKVSHHREVLFVKPDIWIITDHMVPQDDQEHDYRALFHLSPGSITTDAETQTASTDWNDGGFRVMPLNPEAVDLSIIKGQTEPYYLGWTPTGGQTKKPSQVAVYNWKASGPTTQSWALFPKRKGQWTIQDIRLRETSPEGSLSAWINTADGKHKLERVPGTNSPEKGEYIYQKFGLSIGAGGGEFRTSE